MEIGEFQLIEKIQNQFHTNSLQEIGIGDDCAVIPYTKSHSYIISTDALVEEVHFKLSTISFYQLGKKSIAVNLSDIAGMGGISKYVFISLAIPKSIKQESILEFYQGIKDILTQFDVSLLGGDTVSSMSNLFISVTAVGIAENDKILYRNSAKVGDNIYVTGTLGDSAIGLDILLKQIQKSGPETEKLINKHLSPTPRIKEMQYLNKHYQISSAIDMSDGLSMDLSHILKSSKVGAKLDWDLIPKSKELLIIVSKEDQEKYILHGGEDYEILFTSPDKINNPSFPAYKIGEIVEGDYLELQNKSVVKQITPKGFDHFRLN